MVAAKKLTLTTPIGKTEWFSLCKTDKFSNYTSTLILEDSPETHKLISQIDGVADDTFIKKPYEKQADGSFKLKVKGKSKGQKKSGENYIVNPPVLYNSLGKKIEGLELQQLNVGNGSEARFKIEVSSYIMLNQDTQELMKGISCKIKSAQIAKVVEFQGADSASGFDALEMSESDSGEVASTSDYDF